MCTVTSLCTESFLILPHLWTFERKKLIHLLSLSFCLGCLICNFLSSFPQPWPISSPILEFLIIIVLKFLLIRPPLCGSSTKPLRFLVIVMSGFYDPMNCSMPGFPVLQYLWVCSDSYRDGNPIRYSEEPLKPCSLQVGSDFERFRDQFFGETCQEGFYF